MRPSTQLKCPDERCKHSVEAHEPRDTAEGQNPEPSRCRVSGCQCPGWVEAWQTVRVAEAQRLEAEQPSEHSLPEMLGSIVMPGGIGIPFVPGSTIVITVYPPGWNKGDDADAG